MGTFPNLVTSKLIQWVTRVKKSEHIDTCQWLESRVSSLHMGTIYLCRRRTRISYCNDYLITPISDPISRFRQVLGFPVPKASTRPLQKASTLELAGNQWVWRERPVGRAGKSVSTSVGAGGNGRVTARRQCRFGVVSGVGPADRSDRPMKLDLEGRQSVV